VPHPYLESLWTRRPVTFENCAFKAPSDIHANQGNSEILVTDSFNYRLNL